jgi:hypothetical protein
MMLTIGVGYILCFCWTSLLALLHSAADGQMATWEHERWYNENLIAKKFVKSAAAAYAKEDKIENCLGKIFPDGAMVS